MTVLLVLVVALPALAGLLGVAWRPAGEAGRFGAVVTALAAAGAAVLLGSAVAGGPVSAVVAGANGRAVAGLVADRLTATLLLLVLGVSAVVQLYADRLLSGDPRRRRLLTLLGLTTSAVAVTVAAATLSSLVVGWLLSSAGLLALLAHRADLPAARLGLRRTATAMAIGDGALVVAAVLARATVGEVDLRDAGAGYAALAAHRIHLGGAEIAMSTVVACLLVVAAAGRSALLPLPRWLPATLTAPTPVSAFLHAGLVNGGGILLVRTGAIFGSSSAATLLAFAAGTATVVVGTAAMLTRPDVKGALAHSTTAQMGYMVMACAMGAPAAAMVHLVGHSLYKATLFLGADSVVHTGKWRQRVPGVEAGAGLPRPVRALAALAVPAVGLGVAFATFAGVALDHPGAVVLVVFAGVTTARAAWGWLAATPARAAAGLLALTGAAVAYAGLLAAATQLLAPVVQDAAHPIAAPAAVAVLVLILAVAVALSGSATGPDWLGRLRARAWVRALDSGHVPVAAPPRRGTWPAGPVTAHPATSVSRPTVGAH